MTLRTRLSDFARGEDGVISVNNLFTFMAACCVSAAGVDVTAMFQVRSHLQVAADLAAHAALYRLDHDGRTEDQARGDAIALVQATMPPDDFGTVLAEEDILFGWWDSAEETFHVGKPTITDPVTGAEEEGPYSATLVTTRQSDAAGNAARTFLFRMAGFGEMDIETKTVFTVYTPACLQEGFASNDVVDVQSNNGYYDGFCMHSNEYVSLNSNNYFESGTIVSMPDLALLDIPNSGLITNEGLVEALHESYTYLHILDRLDLAGSDPLWTAIRTVGQSERPSYVAPLGNLPKVNVNQNTTLLVSTLVSGGVYWYDCTADRTLTLKPASNGGTVTYQDIVLMTDCQVTISGNVNLNNVIIYTTNISSTSVQVSTAGGSTGGGLRLGMDDNCQKGGGSQIITHGGFRNSAALWMYGSRIIALGDVNFAAQAVGYGASITAEGAINGSSNMEFHGCGVQADNPFQYNYYRAAY